MKTKIISQTQATYLAQRLRQQKKKIVFTNGTFDLIHLGHVRYLQAAKKNGHFLFVGVNSDISVRSYKTPDRPINPEKDRLEVLAALACVDYVILFKTPTPLPLILKIRPHVLVKGADWKLKEIVGAAEVKSWKGKVKRIPLTPQHSTTALIRRIRK